MNAPVSSTPFVEINMTSKGQVLIPKALRDRAGLTPGGPVAVALNDLGQVVVLSPEEARRTVETSEQRRARIRTALMSVEGKYDFGGGTTETIMQALRGDRPV